VVITPHNNIISLNFVCDQVKWESMTGSSTKACVYLTGNTCAIQKKKNVKTNPVFFSFFIPDLQYKPKADIHDAKKVQIPF
jgi:hypothetical protein